MDVRRYWVCRQEQTWFAPVKCAKDNDVSWMSVCAFRRVGVLACCPNRPLPIPDWKCR